MSSRKPSNDARRGFSLIEMLVVISVSALLLGIATSLVFSLRERDRHVRDASVESAQVFRLADALRNDVRRASDVLLSVEGPLAVVSSDGEQIRYELTAEGVRRTVGATADEFRIGSATRWNMERLPGGRVPLVAVTLDQPLDNDKFRAPPLVVYAALGADLPPVDN